jgi:hypothetical protein
MKIWRKLRKTEKSHRMVSNPTETQNLNLVIITADLSWYTIKDRYLATGIRPKHILVLTLDRRRQYPLCLPKENEDIRVYTYTLTPTHIHTFTHTNVDVRLEGRGYNSAPRKNLTNQYLQCLVILTLISGVQILFSFTSCDRQPASTTSSQTCVLLQKAVNLLVTPHLSGSAVNLRSSSIKNTVNMKSIKVLLTLCLQLK